MEYGGQNNYEGTWPEFSPSSNKAPRDRHISAGVRLPAACIIGRHFTKELASQMLNRTSKVHNIRFCVFPCTNAVNLSEKSLVKSLHELKTGLLFPGTGSMYYRTQSGGCPQARSSHGCWDGWVRVPETRKRERSPTQHDFSSLKVNIIAFGPSSSSCHKVLTYIVYRAVSGVFQTIDPPTPSPPSECVLPPYQRREGTHSPGDEGVGGQYFGRRQTLDWPLTV